MADRPEMFAPTRGFSGMADSMEPCTMLWGRPLLLIFGFFDKIPHESSCIPDRPDMFGPTSGDDQRGRPLLPRQRHLRQARSLIAYRLVNFFSYFKLARLKLCREPVSLLSPGQLAPRVVSCTFFVILCICL